MGKTYVQLFKIIFRNNPEQKQEINLKHILVEPRKLEHTFSFFLYILHLHIKTSVLKIMKETKGFLKCTQQRIKKINKFPGYHLGKEV